MKRKILGIDPGTLLTGYGIVSVDERRQFLSSITDASARQHISRSQVVIVLFFARWKCFLSVMPLRLWQSKLNISIKIHRVESNWAWHVGLWFWQQLCEKFLFLSMLQRVQSVQWLEMARRAKRRCNRWCSFYCRFLSCRSREDAADALALAICHGQAFSVGTLL